MVKPCPKPTKEKKRGKKKYVPPRARLKKQLYKLLGDLVKWRDGYECVQRNSRGGKCWGAPTDGHVIPRADYGVTFDLLNNHCQCEGHNGWHRYHYTDYEDWFIGTFGHAAWQHLKDKARSVQSEKSIPTADLEDLLRQYQELWDNRPAVYDRRWLIGLGYFGEWAKEHLA